MLTMTRWGEREGGVTPFEGTHRDSMELLRLLQAVVCKEKHAAIARRFDWQRAWVIEMVRRLGKEPFVQHLRGDFGEDKEKYHGIWPSDIRKLLGKLYRAERAQQESEGRA